MQMFLSKWISGRFSRILGYESRESGREIIPGMHKWAQLGFLGRGAWPHRGLIGCYRLPISPTWAHGPCVCVCVPGAIFLTDVRWHPELGCYERICLETLIH